MVKAPLPPFKMKQFWLHHQRSAMKVGTDGVLLGAYVAKYLKGQEPQRVLDVGTGCGVVALMLAQAFATSHIVGIELDQASAEEATQNAFLSPFSERITIVDGAVQNYTSTEQFHLIVSNPPFFTATHTTSDARKTVAKHIGTLTPQALFASASALLHTTQGKVALIVPSSTIEEYRSAAQAEQFQLLHQLDIHTTPNALAKRHILIWQKSTAIALPFSSASLTIHNQSTARHQYSPAYIELLRPYLLIFE